MNESVRLSLRLLTTSRLIEREVDALMRAKFDSTIARFDFLSALDRRGPLTLGEVSQYLLVSNGNVTQLRTRLSEDGLIETEQDENDRRIQRVRLTRQGESVFKYMAKAHAACVDALLRDLTQADKNALSRLLDAAKASLRRKLTKGSGAVINDAWNSAEYKAEHFLWAVENRVATITLNRPERKNPLTFESYAELRDLFRRLCYADDCRAIVVTGAGGNFCSGGDVHDIIAPLTKMTMPELMRFTRMTGDLVKAMRACPQPIVAAVEGACAGAGAILAMASDIRFAAPDAKTAFLFTRVGLAGCDMGACAILPRIIGHGRASELLYTGRSMSAEEGERWGFFNKITETPLAESQAFAASLATGPAFSHSMTKNQLNMEWNMSLEQALEAEAQAQAICMQTKDFERAYLAFASKQKPVFEGD